MRGVVAICSSLLMLSLALADTLYVDDSSAQVEDLLKGTVRENINRNQFQDLLKNCDVALVTFYAPWCGFCTTFLPELAKAASVLAKEGIEACIATVDGTVEEELALDEELDGYPTINLYKYGKRHSVYLSGRTSSDVAEYLRQKTEPDVKFVSSVPELELILQREDHLFQRNGYVDEESISVILGLFPKLGLEESTDGPFNWAKKWYRHEEEERLFGEIRVELDKLQAEIENSTVTKVQSDLALRLNDLNARFSALKQQFFSYSKDESSLPIQIFKHFVRKFDYARFYVTESQDIFNHFDVHENALIVYSYKYPQGKKVLILDEHTTADLEKMIISLTAPSVLSFSEKKSLIDTLPVKEHVLLFVKDPKNDLASRLLMDQVDSISPSFHGRLLFIKIDDSELSVMQYFNIKPSDLPQVILVDMRDPENMDKYIMTADFQDQTISADDVNTNKMNKLLSPSRFHFHEKPPQITVDALGKVSIQEKRPSSVGGNGIYDKVDANLLESFLDAYLDGILPKSLFSEDESSSQSLAVRKKSENGKPVGKVVNLVGSNFNKHIFDGPDVDVLAFFYAPWCSFSKSATPIFQEVSSLLGNESIMYNLESMGQETSGVGNVDMAADATFSYLSVVQVDATKNEIDHPRVKIVGFPSIELFRRGDRMFPVSYDGEYTLTAILEFLSENRVPMSSEELAASKRSSETDAPLESSDPKPHVEL